MKIDFSIMPTLECDLACSFCMYDAGPDQKQVLDIDKTAKFIKTWDLKKINMVGFYGGEPAINLPLYQKFIDLIPRGINKFIITNGTWSTDVARMSDFTNFAVHNKLYIIVSGTPEHVPHQNRLVLDIVHDMCPTGVRLKGGDVIHNMGRGKDYPGAVDSCSGFCGVDTRPTRLAIMPNENVVYQNCHGNYPFVQTIDTSFEGIEERIRSTIEDCRKEKRIIR